ncbi:phosphatidylinositol 5-phosphate 4-kinase type-2 alpha-like [Babylonia areolata]|uniref:phosphatidylinositol 5-phosphate 4-kinase type-2 alpha-like n=1 Tax=Babylonia areolata TaxID=304850 RepID=UPI003FD0800D
MSAPATKRKHLKLKAVAPKQKLFRANDPLLSVFMWGINHTISELNQVNMQVMLMPDDFKSYSKIRVDNHMFNKDNMPSHFKVKEYCPLVFRNLRQKFGIDDMQYMQSLTSDIRLTDAAGKSGARLFLSCDQRYFIKTMVSEEVEIMHHILKQYHQYVVECHAQTLLPQYLGMYRITVNDTETYLLVMKNVFSPRLSLHTKYDLKGSTVDRQASDKERAKDVPTLKDNDFVSDKAMIRVGEKEKERLMNMLHSDVQFLSGLHLMDYSLIVGIHDVNAEEKPTSFFPEACDTLQEVEEEVETVEEEAGEEGEEGEEKGVEENGEGPPTPPDSPHPVTPFTPYTGSLDEDLERFAVPSLTAEGVETGEIYFMALIDVLTKYGMKKRTAQAAKTVKHGAGADISTVKPDQYARRFLEFISKCME